MTLTRRGKTFQDLCREAKSRIHEISKEELQSWLDSKKAGGKKFVLLDVRETPEFEAAAIPGAIHISRGVLEINIDDAVPDQDQTIVLYCGGGNRSALAADTLQQMGYESVYSLIGGWRGWNS